MTILSRWLAPAVLAAGLGAGALTPAPAHAQEDLTRVIVDIADVVMRGGQPYYRNSDYGYDDRLIVQRDRYGRPIYYRNVYGSQAPYGYNNSYNGNYNSNYNINNNRKVKCNKNGKCKVEYYDPRYDRDGRYVRYDQRHDQRYDRQGRYWDGYRWRDRYDD